MPFRVLLQVHDPIFWATLRGGSPGTIWYGTAPILLEFTLMNRHHSLTTTFHA